MYGHFGPITTGVAKFYRRSGMSLGEPGAPLDLRTHIDIPAVVSPAPGETLFHEAVNQ